jgi:hypothetical protein
MPSIDEAIEFFAAFFDAEFTAMDANLAGAADFPRLHKKMQSMLAEASVFKIPRIEVAKLTGSSKLTYENTRKDLAARQLFLVEEHQIGKRKLYCGFAGPDRIPKKVTGYEMQFWADNSPQIIATYFACADCRGLGTLNAAACNECRGRGWFHSTGDKLKPGKPTAVKKLIRPTKALCAEDYDQR